MPVIHPEHDRNFAIKSLEKQAAMRASCAVSFFGK
jgi:hypothetical protein